jgi:hypothetical protein
VRVVLGETLKSKYEDLFVPSLGLAQSLGKTGFPARFFFSPVGVFETPFGAFRTEAWQGSAGAQDCRNPTDRISIDRGSDST